MVGECQDVTRREGGGGFQLGQGTLVQRILDGVHRILDGVHCIEFWRGYVEY